MIFDKSKLVEVCKIHARREEYLRKVESALSIVKQYYRPERSYVSCSGGKDSLALTHLIVHNVDPDVVVFHWDHGRWLVPRWIENDIVDCIKSIPVRNLVVRRYGFGSASEWSRIDYRRWYEAFFSAVSEIVRDLGLEVCFLGLRAEESHVRRRRTMNVVEHHKSTGQLMVYPLRDWTWLDVWTYIVTNRVRYPRIYDVYARIIGYDKVRLVTFFDKEFEGVGTYYIDSVLLWRWQSSP